MSKDIDVSDIDVPDFVEEEADLLPEVDLTQELANIKKFKDRPTAAAALAAADAASFSLAGRALNEIGALSTEEQQKLREFNPGADVAGTVVGTVAPLFVPGGQFTAAGAAAKAGAAVERTVAKSLAQAAAETGTKKLAQNLVQKATARGLGSAVEGAALGGQGLLREQALGEADLNAENLLSYGGTGALYGGLIGASLPVAGAAAKGVGRVAKDVFGKAATRIADPVENAVELTGLTPAAVTKLKSHTAGQELLDNLPTWYAKEAKIGLADNGSKILQKVEATKARAAQEIDQVVAAVDEVRVANPANLALDVEKRAATYNNIAQSLEDKFVKPYADLKSFRPQVRKVGALIDDVRSFAQKPGRITATEMRDLRIKMDKLAKSFYENMKPSEASLAAFETRSLLKQAINDFASEASPELAKRLQKANKDYYTASVLEKPLQKRLQQNGDVVTFKDLIIGSVGGGLFGAEGIALAAARKFLNSDFKKKLVVLKNIESANKQNARKVGQSIDNFFSGTVSARKATKLGSISALLQSQNNTEKTDRKKAFKELSTNLKDMQADPEKLHKRLVVANSALSLAAPETAQVVAERLSKAVSFLSQKMPKDFRPVPSLGSAREYEPTSMELAKFERYVQAVDRPMSVLEDLERGTLTREHVEALEAVYPRLLTEIRLKIMDKLGAGASVPYNRRIQMGLLLGIPTDSSLDAKTVLALQQNFGAQGEGGQAEAQGGQNAMAGAVKPTAGALSRVDFASRVGTDSERIMKKES